VERRIVLPVHPTTESPDAVEHRAVLRIAASGGNDADVSAKRFQGVWLEVAGGERWLVDYRANPLWRSFADRAVIVTGHHYAPDPWAQAIRADHFEVGRMRLADTPMGSSPLREIGPKQRLSGTFTARAWPDTSKLAGSVELVFETAGTSYPLASSPAGIEPGPATITARFVDPDPTYAATTSGPQLWIIAVH
jgi:hypothetical protein